MLETCHFRNIQLCDLDLPGSTTALIRSNRARTMLRIAQQAFSHVY
jgi:hypothetical protein